jgi:GT2 family glycosyltransferase
MSLPLVTIIVPVFNQLHFTSQCLERVLELSAALPFEVLVVNNGSTDGTKDYLRELKEKAPALRIIECDRNLGYAEANNAAARDAKGELLVLLNNDTLPTSGWLESLYCGLLTRKAGIAGSLLLDPVTNRINHAGYVYNPKLQGFYPLYGDCDAALTKPRQQRTFQALLGACLMLSKKLFLACGGFEKFGLEDIDLCLKAFARGERSWLIPESKVFHFGSVTLKRSAPGTIESADTAEFNRRWGPDKLRWDDVEFYEADGFVRTAQAYRDDRLKKPGDAARILLQSAEQAHQAKDLETARAALTEGIAIFPLVPDFYLELIAVEQKAGDSRRARELTDLLCGAMPRYEGSKALLENLSR